MTTKILENGDSKSLKERLEGFETALATPIVSGELADWLDAVHHVWKPTEEQIREQIAVRHKPQLDQMGTEDESLLPRVEQLQKEDSAIEHELIEFARHIERAVEIAPKLEPDEEKATNLVQSLVDGGIGLVTRVRKQEVAIQTWFTEAFTRDRGSVD